MLEDVSSTMSARPFNPFEEEIPKEFVVVGTGDRGRRCRRRLERLGIQVICFADNNPQRQGTVIDGLSVVSPAELMASAPDVPVIICSWALQGIFDQLLSMGFKDIYCDNLSERPPLSLLREHTASIEKILVWLEDDESKRTYGDVLKYRFFGTPFTYYSNYPMYAHPLVKAQKGDCIIDGGAASGDTVLFFSKESGGDCTIYPFEPTLQSFHEMKLYLSQLGLKNIHPANLALWNRNESVTFFEAYETSHGNKIDNEGGLRVKAITLDSFVSQKDIKKVDLIKLDIEGAELAALEGAKETIRRFRPRLQICLYHRHEDLWELPLFIKELVPEYRLRVGHHSCRHLDTVLYCRV